MPAQISKHQTDGKKREGERLKREGKWEKRERGTDRETDRQFRNLMSGSADKESVQFQGVQDTGNIFLPKDK